MKHKILVARPIFEEVLTHLRQHFDVTDNQADVPWTWPVGCRPCLSTMVR